MPSFDAVLDPNLVEVRNAVDQTTKEIGTRFDFKGTSAAIEFKEKEKQIIVTGDSDFQLDQVRDILTNKLTKRLMLQPAQGDQLLDGLRVGCGDEITVILIPFV